jgi:hypothetical protein
MQAGGIWDLDNSSYNNEYHGFATKNIGNAGLFGIIQNSAALANGVTTGKQGGLLNLRGYRGDAQPGDVYVNDPSRALALTCGLMLATAQITAGTYNVPPTPGTAGAYFSPSVYTFTGPASSILTLNGGYASSTTQPVNVSGNEQNIGLFQIIVNATANPVTIATQGGTQNIIGHGASGTTYTLAANTAAIFVSISNAGTGAWLVI